MGLKYMTRGEATVLNLCHIAAVVPCFFQGVVGCKEWIHVCPPLVLTSSVCIVLAFRFLVVIPAAWSSSKKERS
jgi:hypothetical protein